MKKWIRRLAYASVIGIVTILFFVLPVAASFLITNSGFRFPDGGIDPQKLGLPVEAIEFTSSDGINLSGWWNAGEPDAPIVIFCHGLNRSRQELLERAAEAHRRGYGVLLFDFRNHGESGEAYTTLGIHETRDVCAASQVAQTKGPERPQFLWGVSLGAATALLAVRDCGGFSGAVADSAFPSFRETIAHHLTLIFGLPPFPIANLIVAITSFRMKMDPDNGDVESAVRHFGNVPVLFIAGSEDQRMPPEVARRLYDAAQSPLKQILVVPGAGHGHAFEVAPAQYLEAVFRFFAAIRGDDPDRKDLN